jgi:hypothetical protein
MFGFAVNSAASLKSAGASKTQKRLNTEERYTNLDFSGLANHNIFRVDLSVDQAYAVKVF